MAGLLVAFVLIGASLVPIAATSAFGVPVLIMAAAAAVLILAIALRPVRFGGRGRPSTADLDDAADRSVPGQRHRRGRQAPGLDPVRRRPGGGAAPGARG